MLSLDPIILVREMIPTVVLLCVVVGSSLLWTRTKRVPALLQLIASSVLLLETLLENFRTIANITPYDSWWFSRLLWSRAFADTMIPVTMVCVIIFAAAYLCYALGHKRI
jgi:hypothetical protein